MKTQKTTSRIVGQLKIATLNLNEYKNIWHLSPPRKLFFITPENVSKCLPWENPNILWSKLAYREVVAGGEAAHYAPTTPAGAVGGMTSRVSQCRVAEPRVPANNTTDVVHSFIVVFLMTSEVNDRQRLYFCGYFEVEKFSLRLKYNQKLPAIYIIKNKLHCVSHTKNGNGKTGLIILFCSSH